MPDPVPGASVAPADHPPRLLEDYAARARARQGTLADTALRTRSLAARHILAHEAAHTGSPHALTDLAAVIALQRLLPSDQRDALALLDLALDRYGPEEIPPVRQGLHAQLAFFLGDPARARDLVEAYSDIPPRVRSALLLDLANPFTNSTGNAPAAEAGWLAALQKLFPVPGPWLASPSDAVAFDLPPFDRLTGAAGRSVQTDVRVTVIITTSLPDARLVTAVRSMVAQSWADLEILIVDDGSPPDHDPVLKQCLDLDDRVRLITMPTNRGTYAARNAGLDSATGQIVTFHDSDDWSHPLRIEHQVRPLLADPALVATLSRGVRASEDLTLTRPGRVMVSEMGTSLTFWKERVRARIGYFDGVRKAADTEYLLRMKTVYGGQAVHSLTGTQYSLNRMASGSLSSSDFEAGWRHPARAAYRWAYDLWHQQIRDNRADPYLPRELTDRPFPAPVQLRHAGPAPARTYDVILASDWRPYGGPQKSMIEEIRALTRHGMRVGVLQLEAFRFMTSRARPLCGPIQELINDGTVDHVLFHDDNVRTSLLVVRYPPVLQFPPSTPSDIRAGRVVILANQAPSELDGTDQRYQPQTCHDVARQLFATEPVWCPQGPVIRDLLRDHLPPAALAPFDLPGIIDLGRWRVECTGFRSTVPVIGRHSRDNWIKWPADGPTVRQVYPDSTDIDVRVMGGVEVPRRLLGSGQEPPSWLVYGYDEVSVRSFLYQLDFYVYFPHPVAVEAFGRAILEALAVGCVTILPPQFERGFGNAALYCAPDQVMDVVADYRADRKRFLAQVERAAQRVRELYCHDAYVERVRSLLGQR